MLATGELEELKRLASEVETAAQGKMRAEMALAWGVLAFCERSYGNQARLAKALGLSSPYVSDIAHGNRGIGDKTVRKLVNLKVSKVKTPSAARPRKGKSSSL